MNSLTEQEEWISAAETIALARAAMGLVAAPRAICKRAHAGLVKARAQRLIIDSESRDNADLPSQIWWAEGEAALEQNWNTGDFETWIDRRCRIRAFGVSFSRADIQMMLPSPTIQRQEQREMKPVGDKIFLGHGSSSQWLHLHNFLKERLRLPVEEFSSSAPAGITIIDRLKVMLDNAAFAFLVMTAEDEQPNGELRPRLNVVHEAGLFQGRWGFEMAIILLEDGCDEFSNIHGLTQIRFPKNNIAACFEEIRRTLEREGLISSV
jgi:hypothetical protein